MRYPGTLTYSKIAIEDYVGVKSRYIGKIYDRINTAQDANTDYIILDAGASSDNDYYNGCYITIIEGTGKGQTRLITDYSGTTKIATIDNAWEVIPNTTSVFRIYSGRFVPYNSNTVNESIATIESEMNIGRFFKDNIYRGSRHVEGSVSGIEVDIENINVFLKAVLGKETNISLISGTNVYKREFIPEENTQIQLPSITFEFFKKNIFWYTGVFAKTLKLYAEVDNLLKCDVDFIGMEEIESTNPTQDRQEPIYIKADSFKYYEGKMRFRSYSSQWATEFPLNDHYVELPIDKFEINYDNGVEHKNTFKGMEEVVANGALQAGSTTTQVILSATSSNEWNKYNGLYFKVMSGTMIGTTVKIIGYNPLTKTATLETALPSAPAEGTLYELWNMHTNIYPYTIDRKEGKIEITLDNDLDDLMMKIRREYKNDYDCSVHLVFETTEPIFGSQKGRLEVIIPRCKIESFDMEVSGKEFIPANFKLIGLAPESGEPAIKFIVYNTRAVEY